MNGERYCYDNNEYLIEMYKAIQNGWVHPTEITEEQYQYIRQHKDEDKALTAFVGIGCAFGGKWFGGFARDRKGAWNFADAASRSLTKPGLYDGIIFDVRDYRDIYPENSLIYCDSPYRGRISGYITTNFDTNEFWNIMREWSSNNTVIISEVSAPSDFKCIKEISVKRNMKNSDNKRDMDMEKLFRYQG